MNWILTSGSTVVLTGAGMSTESSLPDFRSKEGWWKNIDPRTVASTEALSHHYDLFHSFYKARLDNLDQASPHNGHRALANWEKYGRIDAVATQNVDGLHQAAGSQTVYELHGSIRRFRCHQCGEELPRSTFIEKEACSCGGRIRPGVVLFGEMLPAEAWEPAMEKMERSDLSIVIGTSLEVYPANQLPAVTRGRTAYINKDIQTGAGDFDLVIRGNAGEVLTTMNTYMDEVLME
nr:NAD-dependent deacylase [Alkalicoccus chagannorensis]